MANPATPTVPNAPGVPPVKPGVPETTSPDIVVTAKREDGANVNRKTKARWGIYTAGGALAIAPDSFRELDDSKDWNIPRYPIESGAFQSYNKVEQPADVRLAVVKAGNDAAKDAFLKKVHSYASSLELLSVVTPGKTYRNMNLVHYEQHRSAETGAGLLTVRLFFQEVRTSAKSAFSEVAEPTAASNVNGGAVQPGAPSPSQIPPGAPQ